MRGAKDDDKATYGIAYAESKDGLAWTRPELGLHEWKGTRANNIVRRGNAGFRASGQQILQLPDAARRGFRYVMAYHSSGAKRGNNGIHVAGSQDGIHWDLASDGMVFGSPDWIEVGNEWWIYYAGWDGPHGIPEREGSIGLAKLRKEGFISLHGPKGGGVVCTRQLRWPGGDLIVNAAAHAGEMKVRVSDEFRKPIAGFDYDDMPAFAGDSVAEKVKWRGRSLNDLKGRVLRLEFQLRDADLYTFRAAAGE